MRRSSSAHRREEEESPLVMARRHGAVARRFDIFLEQDDVIVGDAAAVNAPDARSYTSLERSPRPACMFHVATARTTGDDDGAGGCGCGHAARRQKSAD